jgi:hypothetical protein
MKFVNLPYSPYSLEVKNGDFSWNCIFRESEVTE